MTKTIEWPPGSGRRAEYDTDELEMFAGMRAQLDAGEIEPSAFISECTVIHELKLSLGATLMSDDEAADLRRRHPAPWDEAAQLATRARARSTDPATSKAAAASITPDALRATQQAVLDAFSMFGPMHHELLIAKYEDSGLPPQSVSGLRTRTKELVDAGFLRASGRTVMLSSKRHSIVWELANPVQGSLL